jgi:hypothetical protein
VQALDGADMLLHASVVRLRLAELAGDADAAAAVRAAMRGRAVVASDAMAAMMLPAPVSASRG